jgi:hypothetical protein
VGGEPLGVHRTKTWAETNMTCQHERCSRGARLVAKVPHGRRRTLERPALAAGLSVVQARPGVRRRLGRGQGTGRRRARSGGVKPRCRPIPEPLVSTGKVVRDDDGMPIAIWRYSDALMIAHLKARHPGMLNHIEQIHRVVIDSTA